MYERRIVIPLFYMADKKKSKAPESTFMDIVRRLTERVPGVRFVDVTRLLEKDTKTAILQSQNHVVTIEELHERSHLKKLIATAHDSDIFAFFIHNSELIRDHPSWYFFVDRRRAFDSGVHWCLLYKDDFWMPNPTMAVTKAIDAAVNVLFNNDICCICLEKLTSAESTLLLPCDHPVHIGCMNTWRLSGSGTCPLCRA